MAFPLFAHKKIVSVYQTAAEQRQATHDHMSNVDINGQARSQTQAHELSGSLTYCEDRAGQAPASQSFAHKKKSSVFLKRR